MNKAKAWLENYWYHYKWMTIIVVSSLIALSVCLVQCTKKEDYDMYALYAGNVYIGGEQSSQLADAINDHMSADKQKVCINSFVYVSEEVKKAYQEGDAYYNSGINLQQKSDFFDFLYTAGFNMLILDRELYSFIEKGEILLPMSEVSNEAGAISEDGYCIKLYDTNLPEKYSIFASMPESTVLCFRKQVLMQDLASKNNAQSYKYQLSVFRKIILDGK